MPSEEYLASLGSYSTVVAAIISLAALLLTTQGWSLVSIASRKAWATIRPSDAQCARHRWEDIQGYELHICTSMWPKDCHESVHSQDKACWNQTVLKVINCWQANASERVVEKPEQLPLSKNFIQVDYKVILAFIFMCSTWEDDAYDAIYAKEGGLYVAGVEMRLQELDSGTLIVHLKGNFTRKLTKHYVDRLARGHPPLVDDPLGYSITKENDEARGGWVVALGFDPEMTEKLFLPVYLDCVRHRTLSGHVFWRSMDRVLDIMVNIWLKCFSSDSESSRRIAKAIRAIKYIKTGRTISGGDSIFNVGRPTVPPTGSQKRKIIEHFNGSPRISEDIQAAFQAEWEPLLTNVLVAAVEGCMTCIAYLQKDGRELGEALDIDRMRNSTIYVRGC
ncbi:uncharacterized protein FTJAE_7530 [Fusarium tjaetaba]|uniref:Uncharacterized protein n=1 Tax=Fusarium tjaetaba TaxID=1567544 RepID=A0A8H5VS16_9HYPO|nr:uncharacterized protein FTJAE_7530 [Fusarium tjaetaba]KAF5632420.1 hypothetical protein FTJAE_7530 [Fusarium tjaetaba]